MAHFLVRAGRGLALATLLLGAFLLCFQVRVLVGIVLDDKATCCEGTRRRKLRRNRSLLDEKVHCHSVALLKGLGSCLHLRAC